MREFDPIRAKRDELAGLTAVAGSLLRLEHAAEEAMGRAEQQLNDVRKVSGFLRIAIEQCRLNIQKLEDDAASKT